MILHRRDLPIYFFRLYKSHSKLQVVPGNTVWKTFGMVKIKYLITINIIYLSVNNRPIHNYLCHQQIKYFRLHSAKLYYQQDDIELARLAAPWLWLCQSDGDRWGSEPGSLA